MTNFDTEIQKLNIGMSGSNYDRYKLIALYKKEIGTTPKRGTPAEELVAALLKKREG